MISIYIVDSNFFSHNQRALLKATNVFCFDISVHFQTAAAQQPTKPVQNPSICITFLAWLLNTGIDIGNYAGLSLLKINSAKAVDWLRFLFLAQWTALHGERMLTEYKVLQWLEDFLTYSSKQPIPAIMLGLSTFLCGVPVFCFICFAIISSIITFTGFLFIEGKKVLNFL